MLKDTICAISTPLQDGAIGIVRLSGDESIEVVDRIFDRDLTKARSHTVTYGYIMDGNESVDEVLVTVFKAPKTYTREDVVEINCHGSVYLIRKILSLCLANGARLAMPGEFTQRAYLNGRIDLTQAEAVNDIVRSSNCSQAKLAMNGLKGSVCRLLTPLIEDMLNTMANIEVNIDYPEYEDIAQLTDDIVLPKLMDWQKRLTEMIRKAENGRLVHQGIKTVIVGRPNVGKSSLLNALLEEDKAIVTAIPGTTRDLVEGIIQLNNITLHLIDTAGLRETDNEVEMIGIEKSLKALKEAELVIIVLDAAESITEYEKDLIAKTSDKKQIVVYNKKDLFDTKDRLSISALNNDIQPLIYEIERQFHQQMMVINEDILNNERQIALVRQAHESIRQAIASLREGIQLDVVAIDIEQAYTSLKEILGEVSREDLLDTLFSNFCLGK